MHKVGLIVNPIAGMGGKVGLKGTDGPEIVELARKLGATAEAPFRALQALKELEILKDSIEIITCPGAMGESVANKCGFKVTIIGAEKEETSAEDTRQAASEMMKLQIELLLFAGGDGTARDIYSSIKNAMPVIGIPTGVKMHSSVFALNPKRAGELALLYLTGKVKGFREAEVMDIDEELFRKGIVSARLYGYLKIPFERRHVQNVKAATPPSEKYEQEAIAAEVVENMEQDCIYIVGPGTTTRQIMQLLGLDYSLLGVDVVSNGKLLAKDVSEKQLLEIIDDKRSKLIVTPIGGQGYILGRGNQQLSPRIIKKIGKDNIIVVSTKSKLHSLKGAPLLVDSGDGEVDEMLAGYIKVITGYKEYAVYPVSF
ncbi:MAG TPA: ATP-NAD kinase family protein [Fervidobacterium sp.]|nr:ATP-NAD kinase family protein [Fervidobacterium sp.]